MVCGTPDTSIIYIDPTKELQDLENLPKTPSAMWWMDTNIGSIEPSDFYQVGPGAAEHDDDLLVDDGDFDDWIACLVSPLDFVIKVVHETTRMVLPMLEPNDEGGVLAIDEQDKTWYESKYPAEIEIIETSRMWYESYKRPRVAR